MSANGRISLNFSALAYRTILLFLAVILFTGQKAQAAETCTAATGLSATAGANTVKVVYVLPSGISSATLEVVLASASITDATVWMTKAITVPSTATERGDLLPSTKYKYRIKTVCTNGGAVLYSSIGEFATTAATTPTCTAATGLSATAGANAVKVVYVLPSGISSATLEVVLASASITDATVWMTKAITVPSTVTERGDLLPSTKYKYRIKTVCANGGAVLYSSVGDFTTTAATPTCTAATGLSATAGANAVKVVYVLPSGISSATLEVVLASTSITDATVWMTKAITIPSTVTERGDLVPATKYKYRIKTVCANGGAVLYSSVGDFTTTAATPTCTAATGLSATAGANSVKVVHVLPSGISSATLEVVLASTSITDATVWMTKAITIPSTVTERGDLLPSTKYKYRIKTVCANGGAVLYSSVGDFTTTAATPTCTAATGLSATAAANTVKIGYTLPSGISSATLEVVLASTSITDATVWMTKAITIPSTVTERGDLLPSTKYKYRIKTVCTNGGAVLYSSIGEFATTAATTPTCTAATGLSATAGANAVKVVYVLPSGISSATLEVVLASASITDATVWMTKAITVPSTVTERGDLLPSTKYKYRIKTVCANGGAVLYSSVGDFTTTAATPTCTAATGLSATAGANAVKVVYVLPSGISSATLEVVLASTSITDATVWMTKAITIPSTVTERGDLVPATKYKYRIKTVCANGGAVLYSSVGEFATTAATTTATPPVVANCVPATGLSISKLGATSVVVNYTLPAEITAATLEILSATSTSWLSRKLTIPSTSYERNELIPNTKYYYRIKTTCKNGGTSLSVSDYFTTLSSATKSAVLSDVSAKVDEPADLILSCYPNPVKTTLYLNVPGSGNQIVSVKLSNINGAQVYTSQFTENELQQIDVQSFPRGIYVLYVTVGNVTKTVKVALN